MYALPTTLPVTNALAMPTVTSPATTTVLNAATKAISIKLALLIMFLLKAVNII